ncbi:2-succinyl-5-enolpyruvyl-6-hydroxy-3-cyclohexene-1-carboxylic-acid synthase [Flavobacterium frigidarium]|uniref:2-succinyl-5-enolpyruvyl-6-hydroxy-3- cyclohexene-1-carboxylic-acid synthase n=1 Tax=Flavobacterium frigidarium TaxID=99286 RepID=UPI0030D71315
MIYPKIPLAQSVIEICLAKGITTIVISPGSRNAPLTIGFSSRSEFDCYSIADERSAAFFALGIAQQKQTPVALVCSSGSALLNYYPAFAEAFYSQIPLVVLSADRPQNKIDIGDGQTIRQENVYANHSLYNANLTEEASEKNDYEINRAIDTAKYQYGPVHINIPFEEPLYETVNTLSISPKMSSYENQKVTLTTTDLAAYAEIWNNSSRKMVLVGVNPPEFVKQFISDYLANDPTIIVLTETTSNLHHPTFINNIDTIITPFTKEDFETFQPDILLTFGGMIVSKRIKAFFRNYKPQQHWHIDPLRAYDTFGALSKHFEVCPNDFFEKFIPLLDQSVTSDYSNKMAAVVALRKIRTEDYLKTIPFSDFKVFEKVIASLPANSQLQVSNSSAIRYAQLIDIDPSIEVFCNRGTSGIDGSTSTAIGAGVASVKPTVFITGDIGFLYDSNALWNNYIPKNFKIILINNGGGGIFRILPGHKETPVFNTFFETAHSLTAKHMAAMYNLNYSVADDEESLKVALKLLYETNDAPTILEVFTPMTVNDKILLDFFKNLI